MRSIVTISLSLNLHCLKLIVGEACRTFSVLSKPVDSHFSTYEAYDRLSAPYKKFLEGLTAMHSGQFVAQVGCRDLPSMRRLFHSRLERSLRKRKAGHSKTGVALLSTAAITWSRCST